METILYTLKHIEFLVIEVLVLAAVAAVLIGGVYEIVRAQVQESRRRDRIAVKPVAGESLAPQPARP
jgi:Na+-translocating ferredoxin:NAD+ oxidoreductase RnfG subunit